MASLYLDTRHDPDRQTLNRTRCCRIFGDLERGNRRRVVFHFHELRQHAICMWRFEWRPTSEPHWQVKKARPCFLSADVSPSSGRNDRFRPESEPLPEHSQSICPSIRQQRGFFHQDVFATGGDSCQLLCVNHCHDAEKVFGVAATAIPEWLVPRLSAT